MILFTLQILSKTLVIYLYFGIESCVRDGPIFKYENNEFQQIQGRWYDK